MPQQTTRPRQSSAGRFGRTPAASPGRFGRTPSASPGRRAATPAGRRTAATASPSRRPALPKRGRKAEPKGVQKLLKTVTTALPSGKAAKKAAPGKKPLGAAALVGLAGLALKNRDKLPGRGSSDAQPLQPETHVATDATRPVGSPSNGTEGGVTPIN